MDKGLVKLLLGSPLYISWAEAMLYDSCPLLNHFWTLLAQDTFFPNRWPPCHSIICHGLSTELHYHI